MRRSMWIAAGLALSACARGSARDEASPWSVPTSAGGDDGSPAADDGDTGDVGDDGTGEATSAAGEGGDDGDATLASGISIARVEVNQAVAIAIVEGGSPVAPGSRNGELLHGRATMIEAAWVLDPSFSPRAIEARLVLVYADGHEQIVSDTKQPSGAADLSDPSRAFVWRLAPEQVEPELRYRIELHETDGTSRGGTTAGARMPTDGNGDLAVRSEQMSMRVMFVPVSTPDGAPSFGAAELAVVERRMKAAYPVQGLDLNIHATWARTSRLTSLDDAFNYMASLRAQDGEGAGTYYHLILDNGSCCSGNDFADWSGIANIVEDGGYAQPRDGISKLYPEYGDFGWDVVTVLHELGHNHGREHAPCGDPAGPDPQYPYANAGIGARGWDADLDALIDPAAVDPETGTPHTDFMSYCWPNWWSDYSWRALVARVREVSAMAAEPGQRWRLRGVIRPDGEVTWSRVLLPGDGDVAGTARIVVRSHDGGAVELPAHTTRIGDSELAFVVADDPGVIATRIELRLSDGRRLASSRGELFAASLPQ